MSARDGWMKQVDIKRFHGIMLMKQRQMDEWTYIERKKGQNEKLTMMRRTVYSIP